MQAVQLQEVQQVPTVQPNIVQMVAATVERYGQEPAYTCMGRTLSFRELDQLSTRFAHWLAHEQKLKAGDRVAIQLPNLLQYPVVVLGVLKARCVVVNVNPLYTAKELEAQLRNSKARLLVVLANVAHTASSILMHTAVETVVVTEVGDLHGPFRGRLLNLAIRHLKKLIKPFHFQQMLTLNQALQCGKQRAVQHGPLPTDFGGEELAVLQYTGGTTGIAKGAMLSHRNLMSNVYQLETIMGKDCPNAGALMVAPLPLYHIYAFTLNLLVSVYRAHHALLIPNPRDTDGFVKELQRVRVNGFVGINTLYNNLVMHPEFRKLDFSQLQISSSGGMALSERVSTEWLQLTRCPILEGYGLTECSPIIACNTYENLKNGTVGKLAPHTEMVLMTVDGRQAARGEPGEICVKGPQVMQRYWDNPDETAKVFDADGWLHTGDVGVVDEEGFLTIVDRIKDIIIVSGFNVFPIEIENYICTHPDVQDACAVAVGDTFAPQIKLFVVSKSPILTEGMVIDFCRNGLAAYKVPRVVEFRAHLPKSNVGKVLRRELRETPSNAAESA